VQVLPALQLPRKVLFFTTLLSHTNMILCWLHIGAQVGITCTCSKMLQTAARVESSPQLLCKAALIQVALPAYILAVSCAVKIQCAGQGETAVDRLILHPGAQPQRIIITLCWHMCLCHAGARRSASLLAPAAWLALQRHHKVWLCCLTP
jgi:hypothetical protein